MTSSVRSYPSVASSPTSVRSNPFMEPLQTSRKDIVDSSLLSPFYLFVFRLLALCYIIPMFVFRITTSESSKYFRYLTNLAWVGMSFYFAFSATLSFFYLQDKQYLANRWWSRSFDYFHTCSHYFAFLVPLVYWSQLYRQAVDSEGVERFARVSPHTLNLVIMATEMTLSRIPLKLIHSGYTAATLILYLVFSWILIYGGAYPDDPYPYAFFGTLFNIRDRPGMAIVWILVAIFAHVMVFLLPWTLHFIRDKTWGKKSMIDNLSPKRSHDRLSSPNVF